MDGSGSSDTTLSSVVSSSCHWAMVPELLCTRSSSVVQVQIVVVGIVERRADGAAGCRSIELLE